MKKKCASHKDLPIEFICFNTFCQNHLACSKCLIEIHYDHVIQCVLYEYVNNHSITIEEDSSKKCLSNALQKHDFKRELWKFTNSFMDQIASQIENVGESLIDSFNRLSSQQGDLQIFLKQYKCLTNITEIKNLFKNSTSREEFIKQLDILLLDHQKRIQTFTNTYPNLIQQQCQIEMTSYTKLIKQFIEQLQNYKQIFFNINSFQIIGQEGFVQEISQNKENKMMMIAVYHKTFRQNRNYKITIEFTECQSTQNTTFFIGFTILKQIDHKMDVFSQSTTFVLSLSQVQNYTQFTKDTNYDNTLGEEIEQDLKNQINKQKSSKLEVYFNLKNKGKSIIIKFNNHILKYNVKSQILGGSNDEITKCFFNWPTYKLYMQYEAQQFKCTATHQLIE